MWFVATLVSLLVRVTGMLHGTSRGSGLLARLKCPLIPLPSFLSLDALHDRSSFLSLLTKTPEFSHVLETWISPVSHLQPSARSDV